jgi:hypothetical protein
MRSRVATALLVPVLAAVLGPVLAGCAGDPREEYCEAVADHQQALADIVGSGAPDALVEALGIFRDLHEQAPDDVTDEWQQVIGRIDALADALRAAGVDPATYDRDDPPAGVTAADRARIEAAAAQLGSAATVRALQDLDQQARDVCKTPLSL